MRNRFKIILFIILILIIIFVIILLSLHLQKPDDNPVYKTLDTINGYNYTLQDRDTKLMKEEFINLKEVLEKKDIDYELYAEYLSKLFIIDLFTLDNKDNKYDVGSVEYVYTKVVDNYILNVEDTLYKYVIDKHSEERDELAIVSSIDKVSLEETTYVYNDKEYDAYKVNLLWEYVKDLGYPKMGEVTLIKSGNKLEVVSFKGVEV